MSISTLLTTPVLPSDKKENFNPIDLANLSKEDVDNLEWFCG